MEPLSVYLTVDDRVDVVHCHKGWTLEQVRRDRRTAPTAPHRTLALSPSLGLPSLPRLPPPPAFVSPAVSALAVSPFCR